jgi:hypothetical protein
MINSTRNFSRPVKKVAFGALTGYQGRSWLRFWLILARSWLIPEFSKRGGGALWKLITMIAKMPKLRTAV